MPFPSCAYNSSDVSFLNAPLYIVTLPKSQPLQRCPLGIFSSNTFNLPSKKKSRQAHLAAFSRRLFQNPDPAFHLESKGFCLALIASLPNPTELCATLFLGQTSSQFNVIGSYPLEPSTSYSIPARSPRGVGGRLHQRDQLSSSSAVTSKLLLLADLACASLRISSYLTFSQNLQRDPDITASSEPWTR